MVNGAKCISKLNVCKEYVFVGVFSKVVMIAWIYPELLHCGQFVLARVYYSLLFSIACQGAIMVQVNSLYIMLATAMKP